MSIISISEAKKQAQGSVRVAGFVHNLRLKKELAFVDLRDASGIMQLVFETSLAPEAFSVAENLNIESYLEVVGELKEKPAKKGQEEEPKDYELSVSEATLITKSLEQLPIPVMQKIENEASLDLRLDNRWLDLRKPEHQLIFRVWTIFEAGCRDYFLDNNFLQIYTPCLMNTSSETGAEVFEVKYFDRQAYLSQSPQFYKQMAMAAGMEKVFMVGTVFRAEPSFTTRHVTEFTGWDFEIANIASHEDIMMAEEKMLVSGFERLKKANLPIDIEVPVTPFPRWSLKLVKEKLGAIGIKSEKDHDLSPEEEREICRLAKEEAGSDFVFVTDYPIEARPFYHMRHTDDNNLTMSFDLLYRGLEITTGAQREHRIEILEKQAIEKGMNLEELQDYLNFFRFGCPAHGGVGIGPARIIMKLLNLNSVKEACFLPRDVKRLNP
jgi:aspartyl-tRNA synthetase